MRIPLLIETFSNFPEVLNHGMVLALDIFLSSLYLTFQLKEGVI
jgi:hypothetical protein